MSNNLSTFDNPYATMAQGAYPRSPIQFPLDYLDPKQQQVINNNISVPFDFSQSVKVGKKTYPGGRYYSANPSATDHPDWPKNGIVYLQPDPTLKAVPIRTSITTPNPNGGYTTTNPITSTTQKGLLTDEPSGFNAYFLTDTPTLNKKTQQTYLTIRGSDGSFKLTNTSNWDDWLGNNYIFAMGARHVPQAKVATPAISAVLSKIRSSGSSAPLNLTGHSLGTFVTVQGVAGLKNDEIDQIGKLVLFNGPDPTASLKKMGLSDAKIAKLSSKTTYYINPFDMVSNLNRTKPIDQQFGKIKVIVPLHYTTSFENPNAHMFGVYQIGANGDPLIASANFHPELLTASQKLANLNQKAIAKLRALGVSDDLIASFFQGDIINRGTTGYVIWQEYITEYQDIIAETRAASIKWNMENIPKHVARISAASGVEKIRLRSELINMAAQLAVLEVEDQVTQVNKLVTDAKEELGTMVRNVYSQVCSIVHYLPRWEVEGLLADFQVNTLWDEGIEATTRQNAQKFSNNVTELSSGLIQATSQLEAVDQEGAKLFESIVGGF